MSYLKEKNAPLVAWSNNYFTKNPIVFQQNWGGDGQARQFSPKMDHIQISDMAWS